MKKFRPMMFAAEGLGFRSLTGSYKRTLPVASSCSKPNGMVLASILSLIATFRFAFSELAFACMERVSGLSMGMEIFT